MPYPVAPKKASSFHLTAMWYIRFLKVPTCKVSPARLGDDSTRLTITFTITITTDLGDAFLVGDTISQFTNLLTVSLVKSDHETSLLKGRPAELAKSHFPWDPRGRSVTNHFDATLPGNFPISTLRLIILPRGDDLNLHSVMSERMPQGLGIWSDVFSSESGKSTSGRVQRRFPVGHERFLNIWEETGESIARHIW